jgi:hypothetical protein
MNTQTLESTLMKNRILKNEKGGIAVPAIMYFMGAPFILVVLLWLFFFRG